MQKCMPCVMDKNATNKTVCLNYKVEEKNLQQLHMITDYMHQKLDYDQVL